MKNFFSAEYFRLQLPTGQIKMQPFFVPKYFNPNVCRLLQLPTGQIKMQLIQYEVIPNNYTVLLQLPTGQIKMQHWVWVCWDEMGEEYVATPHGSDKNATLQGQELWRAKPKPELQLPTGQIKMQPYF